jgi:hypothetical protein
MQLLTDQREVNQLDERRLQLLADLLTHVDAEWRKVGGTCGCSHGFLPLCHAGRHVLPGVEKRSDGGCRSSG